MIERYLSFLALISIICLSSCTKCQFCEVKEPDSLDIIASNVEICGTNEDLESEKNKLKEEYTCIRCIVYTSFGPTSTGFQCGNRAFTDSIGTAVRDGAIASGLNYVCDIYRDTLVFTCILAKD